MNTSLNPELSPVQERFMVLTRDCGLEYEEALHAIGRRSGGFPEYRHFSRLEQTHKVHELISKGLTEKEAWRVVAGRRIEAAHSGVQESTPLHLPPERPATPSTNGQRSSDPTEPKKAKVLCSTCGKYCSSVAYRGNGRWICTKCQEDLYEVPQVSKQPRDFGRYYSALAKPKYRGLKGVRK